MSNENVKEIDWSEAPDMATHYDRTSDKWHKIENGETWCWFDNKWGRVFAGENYVMERFIARNPAFVQVTMDKPATSTFSMLPGEPAKTEFTYDNAVENKTNINIDWDSAPDGATHFNLRYKTSNYISRTQNCNRGVA